MYFHFRCNFFTFDPEQSLLHAAQHREDEKNRYFLFSTNELVTTSVRKPVDEEKYFLSQFPISFVHLINMFLLSSKSGGMKTQTMSLGFQCSNCPFKSSSKKGIKVWKTSFELNLENVMQFFEGT